MKKFAKMIACALHLIVVVLFVLSAVACSKPEGHQVVQDGDELKMGDFVDGKLSGLGVFLKKGENDISSIGYWEDGVLNGLGGRNSIIYDDVGEFRNGAMNGKGIRKIATGDVYLGDFVDESFQGKGIMFYSDGREYSGNFENNYPEGIGVMKFLDGRLYVGNFKQGLFEGAGTMFLDNGDYWKGNFVRNQPADDAVFHFKAESKCLQGNCKDGIGTARYNDNREYTGVWKGGEEHGNGKMTYPNGNVYEGSWTLGFRSGSGVLKYPNGTFYNGTFRNGVVWTGRVKRVNGAVIDIDKGISGLSVNIN